MVENVLYIPRLRRKSRINLWIFSGVFSVCRLVWLFVLAPRLLSGGSPRTASQGLMIQSTEPRRRCPAGRARGFNRTTITLVTERYYERTCHCPKVSHRSNRQARQLLLVYVRTLQRSALLRWLAQGNDVFTHEGGHHRGEEGGVVRLQTFQERAVLRRITLENLERRRGRGYSRQFWLFNFLRRSKCR